MEQEVFGWLKDKYDSRDLICTGRRMADLPAQHTLIHLVTDAGQQGRVGSCVGWALSTNLVSKALRQDVYIERFSPTWIYNGARFIEGTLHLDRGCYPKDALSWLKNKGCLLERYWPYDPDRVDKSAPPSRLDPQAAEFPLLSYHRVVDSYYGICSAINNGNMVSVGIPWSNRWNPRGVEHLPAIFTEDFSSEWGGHAVTLYGYNSDLRKFYGVNSWGERWGKDGHFSIPFNSFSVFKRIGGYDAHYIKVEWKEKQPPDVEQEELRLRLQAIIDDKPWQTVWDSKVLTSVV